MKKIIVVIFLVVLSFLVVSCAKTKTVIADWDGNYIYYNGYKTKSNGLDSKKILNEFSYNDKTVVIKNFISTYYKQDKLHLIVSDEKDRNYYIMFSPEKNEVLNIYKGSTLLKLWDFEENYVVLEESGNYIYLNEFGNFPAFSKAEKNNLKLIDDYIIVDSNQLKIAKLNDENFSLVTDYKVAYEYHNGRIYFMSKVSIRKYNIYDIKSQKLNSFDIEASSIYVNGMYSYIEYDYEINLYRNYVGFYNHNYEKITIELPLLENKDYYFSVLNGVLNFQWYMIKSDDITVYHLYHIDDNYVVQKGQGGANEEVKETPVENYGSNFCGETSYYYSYDKKQTVFGTRNKAILYAYGRSSRDKKYICQEIDFGSSEIDLEKIVVILPY